MPTQFWKPKDLKEEQIEEIGKRIKKELTNIKTLGVSEKEKKSAKKSKGKTKLTKVAPRRP